MRNHRAEAFREAAEHFAAMAKLYSGQPEQRVYEIVANVLLAKAQGEELG